MPWTQLFACLVVLVGVCVFLYPHAASWFSQKEQSAVTEHAQQALLKPPNDNAQYRADEMKKAHEYNDALSSGALYAANANVAVGEGRSTDESLEYDSLLNTDNNGFMGRIKYDALDIDLPIYHGTSTDTLAQGVGHLEGTSLPVGGSGTRAVLTAHRGLPTATLFTNLNHAKEGDMFTVSVVDEVLAYRVVETQVIDPDETQAILPEPGRDLVSLITCTPLGVNTHRILVTAERVYPTPPQQAASAAQAPDLPGFPWWALILAASVVILGVYIWRTGRTNNRHQPPHEASAEPAPVSEEAANPADTLRAQG